MPTELEAKLKVASHEPVRERLRAIGAKFVARIFETNRFFDTPTQDLRAAGKGLRLRINHNMDTGADEAVVTYKGPRKEGAFKNREEIETSVSDAAGMTAIFGAIGHGETACFEKRRESWTLGDLKIELDEVPHLGLFVEIEGHDEASIQRAREQLGLADAPTITDSYVGMLMAWAEREGRGRVIRFSDG